MKTCRDCRRSLPEGAFLAGKAKRVSSCCADCRKNRAKRHVRTFYARLPTDKRNTLTMRRRADAYGVEHIEYSRVAIMRRWGRKCCYCNEPATHLDHVTPLSGGGGDVESNIVPACAACNLSKGARSLAEWAESFT